MTDLTRLTVTDLIIKNTISGGAGLFPTPSNAVLTSGSVLAYNEILIAADAAVVPAGVTKVDGLSVRLKFGGTAATGGRHGGEFRVIQDSATSTSNTDRNYVGVVGYFQTNSGDGGTPSIARGAGFGGNFVAVLADGVQDYLNLGGVEINTRAGAGSTVRRLAGLQLHHEDKVQASTDYDCALSISAKGVATAFRKTGILFSDFAGQQPIDTSGTMVKTVGSGTVASVIDVSSYTVTGNYFLSGDYVWNTSLLRPIANNSKDLGAASFTWRAVYAGTGFYVGANQILGPRKTGWGTCTGTVSTAAYATYAGQTISATPTQAEVQALDDAVKALSRRFGAYDQGILHAGTSGQGGVVGV